MLRRWLRGRAPWLGPAAVAASFGPIATGASDAQQVDPLLWVMLAISAVGAAVVYAVMAYAVWKFRDPRTRGRRYG